eukprot:TRINITY_DN5065_c0_g1_i1.p1 TRINITY_DN5065_c0_g1~~TRINITY_DN5065_c0_g1_i1.p1  ORF type:complete len:706 (-),score=157.80 TRINITY_DN5065_c0_g1_i1:64-2148(-)
MAENLDEPLFDDAVQPAAAEPAVEPPAPPPPPVTATITVAPQCFLNEDTAVSVTVANTDLTTVQFTLRIHGNVEFKTDILTKDATTLTATFVPTRLGPATVTFMLHDSQKIYEVRTTVVPATMRFYAWGENVSSQLGDLPPQIRLLRSVPGMQSRNVKDVACGPNHCLMLTDEGQVFGAGSNSKAQVLRLQPPRDSIDSFRVIPYFSPSPVVLIGAGSNFSVAVSRTHEQDNFHVWGDGTHGQCGDAGFGCGLPFTVLEDRPRRFVALACGNDHILAVSAEGRVFAWGSNEFGQLGNGAQGGSNAYPTVVEALKPYQIVSVACGFGHCLALSKSGEVFSWGHNHHKQCGHSEGSATVLQPTLVPGIPPASVIAAGGGHSAVIADGLIYTFGLNECGQLGLGIADADLGVARRIPGEQWLDVACGGGHTIALRENRDVYAWGADTQHQAIAIGAPKVDVPKLLHEFSGTQRTRVRASKGNTSFALCHSIPLPDYDPRAFAVSLQFACPPPPQLRKGEAERKVINGGSQWVLLQSRNAVDGVAVPFVFLELRCPSLIDKDRIRVKEGGELPVAVIEGFSEEGVKTFARYIAWDTLPTFKTINEAVEMMKISSKQHFDVEHLFSLAERAVLRLLSTDNCIAVLTAAVDINNEHMRAIVKRFMCDPLNYPAITNFGELPDRLKSEFMPSSLMAHSLLP